MALLRPVPPLLAPFAALAVLATPPSRPSSTSSTTSSTASSTSSATSPATPPGSASSSSPSAPAPLRLDISATHIDPKATAHGLHARVGGLAGWSIDVRDAGVADRLEVALRSPDGRTQTRWLTLVNTTAEDRSRELAASLAILIEQWDDPPEPEPEPVAPQQPRAQPTPRPRPAPEPPVRGWLGVGPRAELGRSPFGGVDLLGGVWLVREHLQPLVSVGWAATAQEGVSLHTIRFGAGLAAGAPLARGRLWLGAHALVHGLWARAHDARTQTLWTGSGEAGGTLQVRGRRWLVGVRTGVDVHLPPLRVRGDLARLRQGPVHWVVGLSFGVIFGGL